MKLIMNSECNAYKLEYLCREKYQKMYEILSCFKKENDIILFMSPDYYVNNYYLSETSKFIKERTIRVTNDYVSPGIGYRDEMPLYWYKLENNDEFRAMVEKRKSYFFACVVVDKNAEPKDYSFEVIYGEFGRFTIREKINGDFITNVLPKLQLVIGDIDSVQGVADEEY
jgi:hypothetical protein